MYLAKRLETFRGYLGTEMNMRLVKMKQEGRDVINLGLGDPDFTPPEHLLENLRDSVSNPDNHHYPSFYSSKPLKEAIAAWYWRRFGVELDPEKEVLPLLGSCDGLFHIHLCLLDVGDIALVPDPSYPSYEAGVKLAGGQVYSFPLLKKNRFLPDLRSIPGDVAKKAKMIWVNYPNNPTGSVADLDFYQELVAWAKTYDVFVVSDNPYSEIYFEHKPPSFLEVEGAREVGVELNSLSKAYNCCGWRVGMLVGNKDIIAGMAKIKSHSDRGIFYPLQVAATNALNGPIDFMQRRNKVFRERRNIVVQGLKDVGLEVESPSATFYVWSTIPSGYSSQEFCLKVLEEANVWMIPGSMYGKYGEGYLRISLIVGVDRIRKAVERIKKIV
ncbi:MAG: aminotransferase class I/II-fold pyridoxal phosphate-dependent enzyme [bacterium]